MNRSSNSMASGKLVAGGLAFALAAALVSGVSVWVNGHAVRQFDDSAVFSTSKNALVGVALLGLFFARPRGAAQLRKLSRREALGLGAIAVIGGSIPFVLFFEGLSQASAANSAVIQKSLFVWVALLAVPLLGERAGPLHIAAIGALVVGQLLIARPAAWDFGAGEAMVLAATLFWSVEVVIARRLLPGIGAQLGATARMAGGATLLLGYLAVTGRLADVFQFNSGQWGWLVLTAAFLISYVSLWYGALRRAPAVAVTCVLTLGAPITAALQVWDGKPIPAGEQLSGYALLVAAAIAIALVAAARPRTMHERVADPVGGVA